MLHGQAFQLQYKNISTEERKMIMTEFRTKSGILVGTLNEETGLFYIIEGIKVRAVEMPPGGLRFHAGKKDKPLEEVYIPPLLKPNIA